MPTMKVQTITIEVSYPIECEGEDYYNAPMMDDDEINEYVDEEVHAGNFKVVSKKIETVELEEK